MDGAALRARVDALAAITEEPGRITRVFATAEHHRANALALNWMRDAGLTAHEDAVGNVIGRREAAQPDAPTLIVGSHLDTVRDAGRWDGILGVVAGIACADALHRSGARLPFALEIVGFADEEGTRFGATMLGSRAMAGRFDPAALDLRDAGGITMRDAMRHGGLDPDGIAACARPPGRVAGYLELHIEQGPVLEQEGLPLGAVSAIAGQTRLTVSLEGRAGHAGTVPMGLRQDALAAAAACILAVERLAAAAPDAVATVGRIAAQPGAVNVIPGHVAFTVDLRAPDDASRAALEAAIRADIAAVAAARGIRAHVARTHELPATRCDPALTGAITEALGAEGLKPRVLPSGAGHDAMAMAAVAPVGMIFVRCRDGLSHHPDEHADDADTALGARVLLRAITAFQPGTATP